jgi:hypothetical protein
MGKLQDWQPPIIKLLRRELKMRLLALNPINKTLPINLAKHKILVINTPMVPINSITGLKTSAANMLIALSSSTDRQWALPSPIIRRRLRDLGPR